VGATDLIRLTKAANTDAADVGDPVLYTLTIANDGDDDVNSVELVDNLPRGFRYHSGSARLDGAPFPPTVSPDGQTLTWSLGVIPAHTSHTLTYVAVVTADALRGDGVNTAVLSANFPLGGSARITASARVRPRAGVFANRTIVIGKVFVDQNDNLLQDGSEPGLAGVRLYLEDGTFVRTDREGKYHLEGLLPGMHTLRLDETTLPPGAKLGLIDSEQAFNPASRFLDLRYGTMHKANFRVLPGTVLVAGQALAQPLSLQPVTVTTVGALTTLQLVTDGPLTPTWEHHPETGLTDLVFPGLRLTRQPAEERLLDPNLEAIRVAVDEAGPAVKVQLRWRKRTAGYAPVTVQRVPTGVALTAGWEQPPDSDPPPGANRSTTASKEPRILSPEDGHAYLTRDQISVTVSAHLAATFELYVNDTVVPKQSIGRKDFAISQRLATYEYVGVPLQPGANVLRFTVRNPGEPQPREMTVTVYRADTPAAVRCTVTPEGLTADGKTEPVIAVSLVDAHGLLTGHGAVVTVSLDRGEILSPDLYPMEPGHQVQLRLGVGQVRLSAATEATTRRLTVRAGALTADYDVVYKPYLRDWIVNGVVGTTVAQERANGTSTPSGGTDTSATESNRLAFFAKGRLPWAMGLTTSYDSSRSNRQSQLFRELDPLRDYPVYGDESEQDYEAKTRDELYVKLEKDQSYLLWGDYDTGLDQTRLAAYRRSFTGAKLHLETRHLDADVFFSHNDQAQVKVELPGRGVSGYYYLPDTNLLVNSESIVIETRDRFHPERVVKSEPRTRYTDYTINYDRGRILFKRPVPSHDLDRNPVFIVIRYEVDGFKAKEYPVYGGRAAIHDADRRFTLGATSIVEESLPHSYTLEGVDGTVELAPRLTLRAEYAESQTTERVSDSAHLVELVSERDRARYRAWYQEIGPEFHNPSLSGETVGRRTIGLEGEFALRDDLSLDLETYHQRDADTLRRREVALADVTYDVGRWDFTLGAGYIREDADSPLAEDQQAKQSPLARAGVGVDLTKRLRLEVFHQHAFGDPDTEQPTRSEADLTYQLNSRTRLSLGLEHRYLPSGSTEMSVIGGIEREITESLTGFQRFRLEDAASGQRVRSGTGLELDHALDDEWRLGITGELSQTLDQKPGDVAAADDDFWAFTIALWYRPLGSDYTVGGRYEIRGSDEAFEHLLEVGGTLKLDRSSTLFGRQVTTWKDARRQQAEDEWTFALLTGWAYRPVAHDQLNLITDLELELEDGTALAAGDTLEQGTLSTEAHYQFTPALLLAGKYAARITDAGFAEDLFFTDVKALRLRYDLTQRFFVGAGARVLTQYDTQTTDYSYGAEVGVNLRKDLRFAIGYNWRGFEDRDFARGEHWREGFYLSLHWKFDESIFGIFNRLRGPEPETK
jgi:uncharacterized repeat protein (TIGR01451 family)